MNPQEGTRLSPFLEGAPLSKPRRGSIMVLSESNVVIC